MGCLIRLEIVAIPAGKWQDVMDTFNIYTTYYSSNCEHQNRCLFRTSSGTAILREDRPVAAGSSSDLMCPEIVKKG